MGDNDTDKQRSAAQRSAEHTQRACAQSAGAPSPSAAPKRTGRREFTFAAAALVLVVGLAEGLLRLAGFHYLPVPILAISRWGPTQLKAMNDELGSNIFQPDDLVFWSMIPGARLDMRQVNELGLLNEPVEIPKPAGVYRILCLGDSCTALGPLAYPMILQKRLDRVRKPDRRFEVINAGVFGYTSLQGRRLFCRRLTDVQPNLVTIYYGWNDHYLTKGHPDKLLQARETRPPALLRLLRQLRLYQLARRIVSSAQISMMGRTQTRVAPEDYRENLRAMMDQANELGARAILLTAPSNHAPGRVPEQFLLTEMAESEEALIVRHRNYNKIAREVAAEKKAELLDLDALFNQRNKDELFLQDGVHPNGGGRHLIADLLVARLAEMGVLSSEDRLRAAQKFVHDSANPNLLRAGIEILGGPLRVAVGRPLEIAVRATNTGDTLWLARPGNNFGLVRFEAMVYSSAGRLLWEKESGHLARDVPPGETVELHWTISPFREPGRYVLDVKGVAEFVSWFTESSDRATTMPLVIEPAGQGK